MSVLMFHIELGVCEQYNSNVFSTVVHMFIIVKTFRLIINFQFGVEHFVRGIIIIIIIIN